MKIKYSCGLMALLLSMSAFILLAQEKPEKSIVKIDLAYHQLNDDLPVLKVTAKTRKEKKFEPVEGVEMNVFFGEETSAGFMGRVATDGHGTGSMVMPLNFKPRWDSLHHFTFIATVTGNALYEDQSAEIEITKAKIELTLDEIDSVRTIKAKVLAFQDTGWVALPETEIKLVVRRLLSDLPATEEDAYTTDESGVAEAEFNLNLPGDANGAIIIGAKIDDHEQFGNIVSSRVVKWGLPLAPDNSFAKRTLWATRDKTPLWLLIFPNLIIVTVWGIIFFLFYQIMKIKKLGKANDLNN